MASYSRRYDGFCADFAYITNARPSGANPKFENQAQPYLGFQNVFDILTGLQAGNQMFSQGVMQQLCCTNVAIQDRADGWYEVTESWQSRMLTSGHYG
jgi:hypothetical protein